jgi:hypothetical protein
MQRLLTPVGSQESAEPTHPRSITIGWKSLKDRRISPPRFQVQAYKWAARNRPEKLYSNLRPGPALFFCHLAEQYGWPLVAVVWPGQFDAAPPGFLRFQRQALEYAEERVEVAEGWAERDEAARGLAPELTLRHLGLR